MVLLSVKNIGLCVETGIFVLRKKDNQTTALHLYHHVSTFLLAWITLKYNAISPLTFMSFINSFIHIIMYIYYLLAAWEPNVQKVVAPKIKRWITIMQMVNSPDFPLHLSPFCRLFCFKPFFSSNYFTNIYSSTIYITH